MSVHPSSVVSGQTKFSLTLYIRFLGEVEFMFLEDTLGMKMLNHDTKKKLK